MEFTITKESGFVRLRRDGMVFTIPKESDFV